VIERATVLGNDDFVRREDIEFAPVPIGEARPPAPAPVTYPSLASGLSGSESAASAASDRAGLASPAEVSSRQKAILDWVREKGSVTSHEYSDHADVSQRTALRDLSELVRRGILARDGTRKAATYHIRNGEKAVSEGAGAPGI